MPKGQGTRARQESLSEEDDELQGFDEAEDLSDSKEKEDISDEEVYGLGDSDDLGDEDLEEKSSEGNDDIDMGSDIEEQDDRLPDDRAWGRSSRRFYNTDYVDQDYEGFYEGKEAEEAELEEQEARQIQKRLVEQLNEADFVIADDAVGPQPAREHMAFEEIERDVSKLSTRQKLDLLQKESPEFLVLVQDFKNRLKEIEETIIPVLKFFEKKQETNPAAKRIPVENHPVLKSLYKYRKLLEQIHDIDVILEPQIDNILQGIKNGTVIIPSELNISGKKDKKIIKLLSKSKMKTGKEGKLDKGVKTGKIQPEEDKSDVAMNIDSDENEEDNKAKVDEKRAITYEMAKNKGLMPKRNKDQRNPRVKHRKKYRKALIRRKGQVRVPRKEIPVYGGELTGIKAGIVKSIKLK